MTTKRKSSSIDDHCAHEVQAQMADLDARRMSFLRGMHGAHRSLDEWAFYPAHDKRKESPQYAKIHREMTVNEDLPCIVCGVRNSTLKKPKSNPYGAKQMETHHHVVEWALANAIDTRKFRDRILAHLASRDPQKYGKKDPRGNVMKDAANRVIPIDFDDKAVRAWVDHDRDNLWVLCDVHHRHKWLGIHAISGPIWGPQDILVEDFEVQVRKALTAAAAPAQKRGRKANGSRAPR